MPAIQAPAKVLVSGANGFIAIYVVRALLERGFSVRGSIRAENKGTHLLRLFKDEIESGKLELVVVPDITAPGAFDEAVVGVDAIEHMASPFVWSAIDPNELIDPAVKGTVGILESALKCSGPQLKRIVLTSSVGSVADMMDVGIKDDTSWNLRSIAEVHEKGSAAAQPVKYMASKSLAERAAWDFVDKNASKMAWDIVTLCPSFVFGPLLHDAASPSELGTSTGLFYQALGSKSKLPEGLAEMEAAWVDVRDVAEGHVRSLEVPEAGGNRFILDGGGFTWQDWFDAANALELPGYNFPTRTPAKKKDYRIRFDTAKARIILGINFHDMSSTVKDTLEDYKTRGW